MTALLYLTGRLEQAVATSQRALRIGTDLHDLSLQAAANSMLAVSYQYLGEYRRTTVHELRVLHALEARAWTRG